MASMMVAASRCKGEMGVNWARSLLCRPSRFTAECLLRLGVDVLTQPALLPTGFDAG